MNADPLTPPSPQRGEGKGEGGIPKLSIGKESQDESDGIG